MPILASNFIEDAFSPLISAFESIMVFIHAHLVGGSWGLAIVGLTVLIRAVLVPLTFRQLKSMQEMQRLAPQIAALKAKYKEDKQRQQQEIMKFYQEHKINPLASCLPLLMQLPVFVSLFYMLRTDLKLDICGKQLQKFYSTELGQKITSNSLIPQSAKVNVKGVKLEGLSGITCSYKHAPDPHHTKFLLAEVPDAGRHLAKFLFLPDITNKATGVALVVLIVLYVGSQLASTLAATATADPTQRRLMLLLPVVFVVILYRYPAGLLVYWITTNLWTIGQQYVIRQRMGPPPPRVEKAKDPNAKPLSALKAALAGATSAPAPVADVRPNGASAPTPPRPPRKKKKRSGRRR
jgi:YidC/Oxa1 family membrane protein insertase